ncbi:MAG: PIN domain-containing protein [Bacteroidota bacterium]|nr:PIN domain-containing protein [Bacteroidota bacterium]
MKIFLDANVLVSVLNKEYPVFSYSSRVMSLADNNKFKVYTSPLCLAIAFYFAEKKTDSTNARARINILSEKLLFTTIGPKAVEWVRKNRKIHDVEDELQYYSAIDAGCKCIVTEDKNDFYFSDIEILSSRNYLEKYAF